MNDDKAGEAMTETKPCPKCDKLMVPCAGPAGTYETPCYGYQWWCACGHRERAPDRRSVVLGKTILLLWTEANGL